MRPTLLILLTLSIVKVASDTIVQAALAKIFPYAAAANVKTLTTQLNKQTTLNASTKALNTWVLKYWKAPTATLVASNPLSKQTYAKNKGITFLHMRYSLKKYINYMYNKAIASKYLTTTEATQMKSLFWEADVQTKNNYTATCEYVAGKASTAIVKTPPIVQEIESMTAAFAKANPTDYSNLHWTL